MFTTVISPSGPLTTPVSATRGSSCTTSTLAGSRRYIGNRNGMRGSRITCQDRTG